LLTSLLKQLSQERTSLPDSIKALYEKHKDKRIPPSFNKISKTFQSVAATYSRVFIIINTLNEYQAFNSYRTRLLIEISTIQAKFGANVFVTSRFIPEITKKFEGSISLEIRTSEEDVQRYLNSHMFRLPGFISRNPEL
jgi:hypothetical protein